MSIFLEFGTGILVCAAWSEICKIRDSLRHDRETVTQEREALEFFDFHNARMLLKKRRKQLAIIAANLPSYQYALRINSQVPLLCEASWIPEHPILLPAPDAALSDDSIALQTEFLNHGPFLKRFNSGPLSVIKASRDIMPVCPHSGQTNCLDYVEAIESVPNECPKAWEDRPSYRLLKVEGSVTSQKLTFTRSSYFEYQRTCEILCYEMALRIFYDNGMLYNASSDVDAIKILNNSLSVRQAVGKWNDLSNRHANAGINNLTILRFGNEYRFLMMKRGTGEAILGTDRHPMYIHEDHGAVASAMGATHVIPAGEFQSSTKAPTRFKEECTIWSTLMREFAEEVLLMPQAKSQSVRVFDFPETPPFSLMIAAAKAKIPRWETYYLGTAIDPLSLKPEIMTVTILDANELKRMYNILYRIDAYKHEQFHKKQVEKILNGDQIVPKANSEGGIFAYNVGGEKLTVDNLRAFWTDDTTLPAAAGCLCLTQHHLKELIS